MKIQINVTKEILFKSRLCGTTFLYNSISNSCAISLAIRDLFPNACIGYSFYSLTGHDELESTDEMRKFVSLFDSSSPEKRIQMNPISFEIEVPDYVINKIGIGTVYKILSESKTLHHVNPSIA